MQIGRKFFTITNGLCTKEGRESTFTLQIPTAASPIHKRHLSRRAGGSPPSLRQVTTLPIPPLPT